MIRNEPLSERAAIEGMGHPRGDTISVMSVDWAC
jgi:hypothetical protein